MILGIRKWPLFPTALVLAAAGIMVSLGVWQLGRADEKEALIALYEGNQDLPPLESFEAFPRENSYTLDSSADWNSDSAENALYRTVEIACPEPRDWRAVAGRNVRGQVGYVHQFVCSTFGQGLGFIDGETMELTTYATIGWSPGPQRPDWDGGTVRGILASAGDDYAVVASEPLAGLEPVARPDPNDLPNNHLAYAGQWFFFALTALVIYVLALRRKQRGEG